MVDVPDRPRTLWRFHSREELELALDEYAHFYAPKAQRMDDAHGGEADEVLELHDRIMRQNQAIDRAMLRLRHVDPLYHRLLDAYYRSGLCNEADGWQRAMRKVAMSHDELHRQPYYALFYHCSSGTERKHNTELFGMLRSCAIGALFFAHRFRSQRRVDSQQRPC